MLQKSEELGEIAPALSKMQGAIRNATKDSKNPHFRSSYASLASVIDAARGPLAENGLSLLQSPETHVDESIVAVTTTILHGSGQFVETTLSCRPKDLSPQAIGSSITYLRRYGMMALLLLGADDDDGNAAGAPEQKKQRERFMPPELSPPPPPPPSSTESDADFDFGANTSDSSEAREAFEERIEEGIASVESLEADIISEKQWKRLYAITMGGAGTTALHRHLLSVYKINNTKRVTREIYDVVCKWADDKENSKEPSEASTSEASAGT